MWLVESGSQATGSRWVSGGQVGGGLICRAGSEGPGDWGIRLAYKTELEMFFSPSGTLQTVFPSREQFGESTISHGLRSR